MSGPERRDRSPITVGQLIDSTEGLIRLPVNAILVDRIGCAYQVISGGSDWINYRGGIDSTRNLFMQAGTEVTYGAGALATVLPVRVVDSGAPSIASRGEPSVNPWRQLLLALGDEGGMSNLTDPEVAAILHEVIRSFEGEEVAGPSRATL